MTRIRTAIAPACMSTILATLAICAALGAPARATPAPPEPAPSSTSATIAPSLTPNRLGAKAALKFTIRYAGGEFGVPAPVRRSVLRFPAGLTLDIPHLSSCTAARLRARGPSGCPAQSEIGSGYALVETHAGTENITEETILSAFLGPPHNLQPTFEIVGQGYTPLDERIVFSGSVLAAEAPYGEELVMPIPAIPTLMFEPDASIVAFSLTIGSSGRHGAHAANTILVPSRCPAGGFPFAAEFTYADGSTGNSTAVTPCPR
jgi:hypothetical protein